MKRILAAEFIGTLVLATVVLLAIETGINLISVPVAAALVLGLLVYSIGPISGCHINPAITLALLTIKQIELRDALAYIVTQLIAGLVAFAIVSTSVGISFDSIFAAKNTSHLLSEFLGTAILAFVIASVVLMKIPEKLSGLIIGSSLFVGVGVGKIFGDGGTLNPAVALATGSLGASNIFGMILGAVVGMKACQILQMSPKETANR